MIKEYVKSERNLRALKYTGGFPPKIFLDNTFVDGRDGGKLYLKTTHSVLEFGYGDYLTLDDEDNLGVIKKDIFEKEYTESEGWFLRKRRLDYIKSVLGEFKLDELSVKNQHFISEIKTHFGLTT